jgi:hypothetical protein
LKELTPNDIADPTADKRKLEFVQGTDFLHLGRMDRLLDGLSFSLGKFHSCLLVGSTTWWFAKKQQFSYFRDS